MQFDPISYFARNPVAANLLMVFLLVGGAVMGSSLRVERTPELDLRRIVVAVPAPGFSPREVEEDINRRIEEAVIGLAGVERVVATARQNRGIVDVYVGTFADKDAVLEEVQNAVDGIEGFPPVNAERPSVFLMRPNFPVVTLYVASSTVSESALRLAAERLRDDLLRLPTASQASLEGTRDREIAIELDEEALRRHDLTIGEVARKVRRASTNLTAGELRTGAGGLVLHTVAKRTAGAEFEDIALIARPGGAVVTLGDVARIRDGFADEDIATRIDGTPAVLVRVETSGRQSYIDLDEDIRTLLAGRETPPGVEVGVWSDRIRPTYEMLSGIVRNGIIGAILVFVCLVAVFDLRVASWISFGIPFSFIGSLLFFGAADMTLNMATLIAFFLLVGVVVDDAVVVGESIAAERQAGKRGVEAAISGAKAVWAPVAVGGITTVLAFTPFFFITSSLYQFLNVFPWVAIFVLIVSFIEAFLILPAHLSPERPLSRPPLSRLQGWTGVRLDGFRDKAVFSAVSWSVRNFALAPAIGALLAVAAASMLGLGVVRPLIFEGNTAIANFVQADLRFPAGTPFEKTLAATERFAAAARAADERLEGDSIASITTVAGGVASSTVGRREPNASHVASVRLHLRDRPERVAAPTEIARAWRREIGDMSHLEEAVFQVTRSQPFSNVAYALLHDDREVLARAAAEMRAFLAALPGVHGVTDNMSPGKRHFEIELTPAGRAAGLTPAAIALQLRANLHGVEVQRIQRGREEIQVVVRYPAERRRGLADLAGERVRRPGGGDMPLSIAARLVEKRELATLARIDGKDAAMVEARADIAETTPREAIRAIDEEFVPGATARYPGLEIQPAGGFRDQRDLLRVLALLVPIALLGMYALMAGFLRSYWKPVLAVAGIPVAFAGAVLGHWMLGWDWTVLSILGLVAVFGVTVNDTLVFLDRYNAIRRENEALPAIAVAAAAARHRFRAVFLTSLTTILGLAPLLYERSDNLIFLVPFVVSMMGGLVLSSLFILFLLPSLVMIAERGEA